MARYWLEILFLAFSVLVFVFPDSVMMKVLWLIAFLGIIDMRGKMVLDWAKKLIKKNNKN